MVKKWAVFLATLILVDSTYANPVGGVVTSGSAAITSPNSTTVQINQASDKAIINWHSFNIAPNETTKFVQPSANSIALNRVDPRQGVSQIYGHLSANGRIILINGAGIYFGPGARVDVGGIIASTSNISDKNFLAGNYIFDQPSTQNGSVVNQGQIIARNNGLVALIGSSVSNEGIIQAHGGNVVLASGNKFTVSLNGDQLINFTVDEAASSAGVDKNGNKLKNAVNNSGAVFADGGTILMTAKTAQGVVDNVINMSGVAQARSVQQHNGEIILLGEDTGHTGNVIVSGKMDASGVNAKGGTAKVLGNTIQIASSAEINTSGDLGGGNIVIGGNAHGKGPDLNARQTSVAKGAVIKADAKVKGDGGSIVVWSDNNTQFHGSLSATGGPQGGNGGFIETSGGYLDVTGATVDLKAPLGSFGTWLLDPTSIFIADNQAAATAVGMTGVDSTADTNSGTSPYSFTPSGGAAESLLTTGTLLAALANGNVVVTTDNTSAAGSGDIYVVNDLLWSNPTSLTLSAYRHVVLQGSIRNGAGANIKVIADNTGTGVGTVCGGGGTTVCAGISPSITVTPAGFLQSFFSSFGAVSVYYNPQTFGTQQTIYTGGTTPVRYMLINSLGAPTDTTGATLASLSNNINNFNFSFANGFFALSKDIDASATSALPWTSRGFIPIGNSTLQFTGRFDGQGHTISNLFINNNASNVSGLFGVIGSPAIVTNVNLLNPSINNTINGAVVGAIVGQTNANTTVSNVSSTGGLIGFTSTIGTLGGLVGNLGGVLSDSYNKSAVTATTLSSAFASNIGGIAGIVNSSASIARTYNIGTVTAGGAAGTPLANVGGIAGNSQSGVAQSISNSYNTGALVFNNVVNTGGTFGGIVGTNGGSSTVANTYNLGNMSSSNYTGTSGGIVGTNSGTTTNSFWDPAATGQANAVGSGNACPTCGSTNLQQTSTYSGAGWNIGLPGFGNTWQMIDGLIYPHLITEGLYTIEGTVYSDAAGTTPVGAGVSVNLASNGGLLATANTDASGHYRFLFSTASGNPVPSGNLAIGSNLLLFPTSGSAGNLVFQTNGQTVTTANILDSTLVTGVTNGNAASNSILASAKGALFNPEILFNFTGNNLSAIAGTNITAKSGYRLDGNLTTVSNGDILFNAPLTLVGPALRTIETTQGGDITFNSINGAGKDLRINTPGAAADIINFNTVSNSAQSIAVFGGLANNDTLRFLDDPLTQNWNMASSIGNTAVINGLTKIGTFNFKNITNLVGSGTITAPNTSNNVWNVTGLYSGNVSMNASNYTFSGFKTLRTGADSESTNNFIVQPGAHVDNIFGVAGNNQTTINYSAYSTPLTLTTTQITSADGVTNVSDAKIVGNDGTSGSSSTVIDSALSITGPNAGSLGTLQFTGFGNAAGIDGVDNLFTFTGDGALGGSLMGGNTGNNNTIDLTASTGSPVNFTYTGSGTGNHGGRGTSTILGGTFNNIDTINNNADAGNTLTGLGVGAFFTLNGAGAGSMTILDTVTTMNFSGFPNISAAVGFLSNNFTINPGADFASLYGGGYSGSTTQFMLNGGNVDFIDGGFGQFSTLMPIIAPTTVNITGPSSGNVTGAATVGSFININVIQQGGTGNTYNIDSSLPALSVTGSSNSVVIGSGGNVGTISGGSDNNYNISGIVGDLLGGTGINSYVLNDGASITNLFGNGSDNLTMNTSGSNTWNVNGTGGSVGGGGATVGGYNGVTNLVGSNNGDTFNLDGTLNSVTGGSGNDVFQLAATSNLGSLNGGGGSNTLNSAPGNSTWTISGPNSGSVGGTGSFSNIQNMIGSATGLNTFIFSGSGSAGFIDGGNMANVSVLNVSGKPQPVDLVLGATKIGGVLQQGSLSSGGVTFATFQQIQSAIGNGGTIVVPDSAVSSIALNPGSTTAGIVGDPFFFNGFIPIQLGGPGSPTVLVPVSTAESSTNISNITAVLILGDLINVPQSYFVEQNLEDLINSQINEDITLANNTTFCFR